MKNDYNATTSGDTHRKENQDRGLHIKCLDGDDGCPRIPGFASGHHSQVALAFWKAASAYSGARYSVVVVVVTVLVVVVVTCKAQLQPKW